MATLYRKKSPVTGRDLPNWYCFFRVPDGHGGTKQFHRATGKKTKKEAEDVASTFEREALKAAGAGDQQSQAILTKVQEAAQLAMRGRLNPAHARRLIGEIMVLGGMGQGLAEFTVEQWIQSWLAEKKATTSAATHRAYQTAMREFLKQLGDRKDRHLETITAADIRTCRDETKKGGRVARTANQRIKILRSCFADAVKASAILQNPADGVKTLEESDSTERAPFQIDQIPKLLDAAPSDDWRGVILLGLYAALRLGDAVTLKAGNVNLDAKTITHMPAKTQRKKRALTIPMHPDLVAFFESREMPAFPGTPLFPSLVTQSIGGKQGLSIQFGKIMDAAGVPRMTSRKSADGAARDMNQLSFHSLRHTTASLMANAGVSAELRMKITGHTSASVHASYTHLAEETAVRAVKAMPSLGRKTAYKPQKRHE